MAIVGRLYNEGDLGIIGEADERLPAVTSGLAAYFPLDGRGGTFDGIGGYQPVQHTVGGVNLLEAMHLNWRDPASWHKGSGTGTVTWDEEKQAIKFTGHWEGYLSTPIIVDYTKHYIWKIIVYQESASATNRLYLGGFSALADGSSFNGGSWDYLMGGGLQLTLSQWVTKTAERTGTGAYPTGWTGSQGLAVKHYFGGLFNYNCQNTTDVVYIRGISIKVSDSDNSNCTITDDGIAVEEATTNASLMDGQNGITPWSGDGTPSLSIIDPSIRFRGRKVARFITGASANCYINDSSELSTAVSDTKWTSSCYIRKVDGSEIESLTGYLYVSGNTNVNGAATLIPVEDGWYRAIYTRTGLTSGYPTLTGFVGMGTSVEYLLADWQVEAKNFATSFVHGSRGEGDLKFSGILSVNKGTVVVDVTFHEDNSVNGLQGSDQYCFGNQVTWNAANCWWFHGTNDWWMRDSNGVTHETFLSSPIVREERTHLAFVYDDTDGTMDIYKNGVLSSNGTKHTDMIGLLGSLGTNWTHSGHGVGTTYKMCQTIHSLGFYNRALTASEIRELAHRAFQITSSGNLVTDEIVEESGYIPSDAYYFPLGFDANDDNLKLVSPSEEVDMVYEDGGVWVGSAAANLIPSPTVNVYPTIGNTHGTYNTNQYNSDTAFSIGTISGVSDNIVTLSVVDHPIYTYDVLHASTTGGGVTAGTHYLIKKHSSTSFSLHAYDNSQDGSKGYAVHDSVNNDVRVTINATSFPTMWHGGAHLPNSALVKEIIPMGFKGIHDCIRFHGEHKPDGDQDYMAYGVTPSVTSGATYIFSFWIRAASDATIGKAIWFALYTSGSWTTTLIEGSGTFVDREWHRLVYRGTAPNTGTTYMYFPFSKGGTIDISEIMSIEKSYAVPFVLSSRSASSLEFNLNSSIGLSWAGDWTIIYWKKPVGTHTSALTGYSIESLGCGSNSVGGGYFYWGKADSSNTIYSSNPSALDPTKYFGTWRMVSIQKTGTTTTIREWSPKEGTYLRTGTSTDSVANYYVTQHGYDLKLGGWDNGSPCNAYYRDLIVVKRCLTDAEVEKIYRSNLSVLNNRAYLHGNLNEASLLS